MCRNSDFEEAQLGAASSAPPKNFAQRDFNP
jgi:hypothetical protein